MSKVIRRSFGMQIAAAKGGEDRTVDVVASTDALDRNGRIVMQDWDLSRFKANPVVLYDHNSWGIPIGFAKSCEVVEGKLLATLCFVDAKANPLAEQVWQGIQQGALRAVSVGWMAKSARVEKVNGKDVVVMSGNELLEISVVPMPANADAVMQQQASFDAAVDALVLASAPAPQPKPAASEAGAANGVTMSLAIVAAILGLASTAPEPEVIEGVKTTKASAEKAERERAALEKELLAATGADSTGKALGIVAGWKASADQLAALKLETAAKEKLAKEEADKAARAALMKEHAKKFTPAMKAWAETQTLDALTGFVASAPEIPGLAGSEVKENLENNPTAGTDVGGKKWEELSRNEKAHLHDTNHALYEALKAEYAKRTGKTVGYARVVQG